MRVLFVCTANICRSPSAEALARAEVARTSSYAAGGLDLASAGTHARDGDPINPEMAAALPAGTDTSAFRSRRLTPALVRDADLVLRMEAAHRAYVLDEHPARFGTVLTLGQLARAVQRAPEGLDRAGLLAHVAATRGHADPALDVPDPYRLGSEAASGCVARLRGLLRVVLPALTS